MTEMHNKDLTVSPIEPDCAWLGRVGILPSQSLIVGHKLYDRHLPLSQKSDIGKPWSSPNGACQAAIRPLFGGHQYTKRTSHRPLPFVNCATEMLFVTKSNGNDNILQRISMTQTIQITRYDLYLYMQRAMLHRPCACCSLRHTCKDLRVHV